MPVYHILRDGDALPRERDTNLSAAMRRAETLLSAVPPGQPVTFTVVRDNGYLIAVETSRRITGTFYRQQWGGRRNDDALDCGQEDFDATDELLLMPLEELRGLEDDSEDTDILGRGYVPWIGPCLVRITAAICEFFGVADLADLTQEALVHARNRLRPHPASQETLTLSVRVTVRVPPGAILTPVVRVDDLLVHSCTAGIAVQAWSIAQPD